MWACGVSWMLFLFLPLELKATGMHETTNLYLKPAITCEISVLHMCSNDLFTSLAHTFKDELKVHVSKARNMKRSLIDEDHCRVNVTVIPKLDRTCLLSSPAPDPEAHLIDSPPVFQVNEYKQLIDDINLLCNTFITVDGHTSVQGLHREYILDNLFHVSMLEHNVMYQDWAREPEMNPLPTCDRVELDTWEAFFNNYVKTSRPVVITNMASEWTAAHKWTNEFLRDKYGNKSVHVKLSPTSNYEGIENAELWDNYKTFHIPESVRAKLPYPDLVVPRPAGVSMNFSQFHDLMDGISKQRITNISGYLEYTSIRHNFPELEADILHSAIASKLTLSNLNIWLSDGNTLGKLHFDPYDNLLCQLDGKKQVTLFEPHMNENLYEAHIPEADYSYNKNTGEFHRSKLLESTRMVMSPFDIRKPNFERFPRFVETRPLNCTISAGDVLFMPSFWWHEVQSYPNLDTARNLAVNFWYEPFLTKEFPCPSCRLDVNPKYRHLL